MMKIKIEFAAVLKIDGIENGSYVEIEEGTTIADLLSRYNVKGEHQRYIIPIVNSKKRRLSYALQANDLVHLLLPVGGG